MNLSQEGKPFNLVVSFFPGLISINSHPPELFRVIIRAVLITAMMTVWRIRGKNYQVCSLQYCAQ